MIVNQISSFDSGLVIYDRIEASSIPSIIKELTGFKLSHDLEIEWLLKAVSLIDLTTLSSFDTPSNVHRLCWKALNPLRTAAVCVYPYQVRNCLESFKRLNEPGFPIASVATGFPSGQFPLQTRLDEIQNAIKDGATEIDIVINRSLALQKDWKGIYDEVRAMREVCGDQAHLKTILATGELESYDNVYAASMTCMLAGADFIKTSTGKEAVNATLPVSFIMARAIRDFHEVYGIKVGFKPAGGLRTAQDAVNYLQLIHNFLGPSWVQPSLLRFGASSLLGTIEARLYALVHNGVNPASGTLDFF